MVTSRKGVGGIDKGKAFNKAVAGSALAQKPASAAGRAMSQKERSGIVAKALATASKRTGAFESRNAKK